MILSTRFEDALTYACTIHAGQTRKGTGVPYISHLLSVAALALEFGANEEEAIGALLHDAAEDAGGRGRLEDIRVRFGDKVADIVDGCTDTYDTPKPDWQNRKEDYIAHLAEASASVLLVSCCDKLHNARSIVMDLKKYGDKLWERFGGGKEGTIWYYETLVERFKEHGAPGGPVDELDRKVKEMQRLASAGGG
jgi:(p)ppGpp synthase/HD superfamily hydrolase